MTIASKRPPRSRSRSHAYRFDRAGAALPLIAVTLIFLFVSAVIGVDIARMHVVRSELRTATDAAARAGVEAIGRTESRDCLLYTSPSPRDQRGSRMPSSA